MLLLVSHAYSAIDMFDWRFIVERNFQVRTNKYNFTMVYKDSLLKYTICIFESDFCKKNHKAQTVGHNNLIFFYKHVTTTKGP